MASDDRKLPPMVSNLGQGDESQRKAAMDAFGTGMASLDLDNLDASLDDAPEEVDKATPEEVAARQVPLSSKAKSRAAASPPAGGSPPAAGEPAGPSWGGKEQALEVDHGDDASNPRAQLEPVPDTAHPPQNRRVPTQRPKPNPNLVLDDPDEDATTAAYPSLTKGTIPKSPPPNVAGGPSPSPAPLPRGLFSSDQITNILIGVAIGAAVMILPAKRMAERYEQREVAPMLDDLEGAVDHPLGVAAGLIEKPASIAARIEDGRSKVRTRFMLIWLLVGLPAGAGVGLIRRR
ncbi:hypothetical protein G6O69_11145 [Pseudenhygromyxa sp. WMMC2535]|uniref:hypothetical protein n=1 Tax=Pseudenhygromyxa sp. WMMC2535 TaxID=2712867 RepID=UPI001554254A|nr:hypothetical protein [Pseudenhygromyxa sp. WMMC2535]NVB38387.1 hypothetical protein [Pseudenhygromyxa sp. WMMC2535]